MEVRQLATHNQEHLLRHVLNLGLRHAQATHPGHRLAKVGVVDLLEDQGIGKLGKVTGLGSAGRAAFLALGTCPPLHGLSMSPERGKLLATTTKGHTCAC